MTTPRSVEFRKDREQEWLELDRLVSVATTRGLNTLPSDDLDRLPILYRRALSSLAVARRTAMDRALVEYLNALAVRAYLVVYTSRPATRAPIRTFLASFPNAVVALRWELLASTILFLTGVAVGTALTVSDPAWFYSFVDEEMAAGRTPEASTATLRNALYDDGGDGLAVFASFLFTHNARIGMAAFATGFAAGLPSAMLLFINGLTLGAFVALYAQRGLFVALMGWLLPHGVPELFAVILCGAAGLHLGRAIVLPAGRTVRVALSENGQSTARVVSGAIVLFAVAGLFEGFFRQLVHDDVFRLLVAFLQVTWIAAWIALLGRRQPEAHQA